MKKFCLKCTDIDAYICNTEGNGTYFTGQIGNPVLRTFLTKHQAKECMQTELKSFSNCVIEEIDIITFECFLDVIPNSAKFTFRNGELKLVGCLDYNVHLRVDNDQLHITGTKGQVLSVLGELDLHRRVKKDFSTCIVSAFKNTIVFLYAKDELKGKTVNRYKILNDKGETVVRLHIPDDHF